MAKESHSSRFNRLAKGRRGKRERGEREEDSSVREGSMKTVRGGGSGGGTEEGENTRA